MVDVTLVLTKLVILAAGAINKPNKFKLEPVAFTKKSGPPRSVRPDTDKLEDEVFPIIAFASEVVPVTLKFPVITKFPVDVPPAN